MKMCEITLLAEPVRSELDLMARYVPLERQRLIELGCGGAHLMRDLLARFSDAQALALEVDQTALARHRAQPTARLQVVDAPAQAIPAPDGQFDGALMLKSLHHVPMAHMDQALAEVARVLKPGAWFWVSEPVYDGPLNEIVRLFNDEGTVRAAAQAAIDRAVAAGRFSQTQRLRFDMPVHWPNFDQFEQRMMRPSFADHALTPERIARVRQAFEAHLGEEGVHLMRPMDVRLLRSAGSGC